MVDAVTGKVLSHKHESPKQDKSENAKEKASSNEQHKLWTSLCGPTLLQRTPANGGLLDPNIKKQLSSLCALLTALRSQFSNLRNVFSDPHGIQRYSIKSNNCLKTQEEE